MSRTPDLAWLAHALLGMVVFGPRALLRARALGMSAWRRAVVPCRAGTDVGDTREAVTSFDTQRLVLAARRE